LLAKPSNIVVAAFYTESEWVFRSPISWTIDLADNNRGRAVATMWPFPPEIEIGLGTVLTAWILRKRSITLRIFISSGFLPS
jgi:hypothetical protein